MDIHLADGDDEPTVVHSVSSTREYERCPARYRFAYRDRVEPARHAPRGWRFGSVVHEGLEAGYRYRWVHGSAGSMLDCLPAALHAVEFAWASYEMPAGDALRRAKRITAQHLLGQRVAGNEILGIEEFFGIDTEDELRIGGYADLVLRDGDGIEVRDHKVTSHERTPTQLVGDFQLNLYGWMAARRWPSATRIVGAHSYPLSGRIVRAPLTDESMHAAYARVARVAERIAEDATYAPRPDAHCRSCQWLDLCAAGRRHLDETAVTSRDGGSSRSARRR